MFPDVSNSGIIFVLERAAQTVIILVGLYRASSLESHLRHLAWEQAAIQHTSVEPIVQIASECEGTGVGCASRTERGSAEVSGRWKGAMLVRGSMGLDMVLLDVIRCIHGLISIARRRHNGVESSRGVDGGDESANVFIARICRARNQKLVGALCTREEPMMDFTTQNVCANSLRDFGRGCCGEGDLRTLALDGGRCCMGPQPHKTKLRRIMCSGQPRRSLGVSLTASSIDSVPVSEDSLALYHTAHGRNHTSVNPGLRRARELQGYTPLTFDKPAVVGLASPWLLPATRPVST